jgi:hypothetical protein
MLQSTMCLASQILSFKLKHPNEWVGGVGGWVGGVGGWSGWVECEREKKGK